MIYIVIKNFNDDLSKRQPWYTVKQLKQDLENSSYEVKIISDIEQALPLYPDDKIIKVFSLKDVIFKSKIRREQLIYLMTFSIYDLKKIIKLDWNTLYKNFSKIDRIIIMAMLPKILINRTLKQASRIISISDRSQIHIEKYDVPQMRYVPYRQDKNQLRDDKTKIRSKINKKHFGYYGPAYRTRYFKEVAEYAKELITNKKIDKFTFVIRDDGELDNGTLQIIEKLKKTDGITVHFGFFKRSELVDYLADVGVFILPFKIVMAEFPVVALEPLLWGKIVITNDESGILRSFSNIKSLIPIDDVTSKSLDIATHSAQGNKFSANVVLIENIISEINEKFMSDFKNVV